MKILHIVGARPNFMKVGPVMRALADLDGITQVLVHTGQHYDPGMSGVFFQQLGLPAPDVNLEVGSGSHAVQTAQIMMRFEEAAKAQMPDLVMVYGDVNSTVACALVCAKTGIPVAHVEAGLRSFDRSMPEEINRLLTDQVSDLLFTPSGDGNENLAREGIPSHKIHLVGNVMIDTLVRLLPQADERWSALKSALGLDGSFGLVTLHRPSNVDDPTRLESAVRTLTEIGASLPLLFPVHPRTRNQLANLKVQTAEHNLKLLEPVGYLDFLALQEHARLVITDSGGIQEETTYLGVPCLTLRENTERPVTVTMGTNTLVGQDFDRLQVETALVLDGDSKRGQIPPLWDGKAGERIAEIILDWKHQ